MTDEVRKFLDGMFAYEDTEEVGKVTLLQCAGTLWTWYQDGVELPDGIKDIDLYEYTQELLGKAKRAEKPIKAFGITVRDVLATTFWVEARDEYEAEAIFDEWSSTPDGCVKIRARLVDSSEGWELDGIPCEYKWDETPDVSWEEGSKLLRGCKI